MRCATCNSDIDSAFKHAISKNECPACGGQIMDEETMALIEDVENTILSEAAVREETAKNLAMVLVARYDVTLRTGMERTIPNRVLLQSQPAKQTQQNIKIAQPSTIQAAMAGENKESDAGIVELSELMSGEISEAEREKIMAEVVKEKMNMIESAVFPEEFQEEFQEEFPSATVARSQPRSSEADAMSNALFGGGGGGILEEERMLRLAKQQRAIQSGSGGFRRGS